MLGKHRSARKDVIGSPHLSVEAALQMPSAVTFTDSEAVDASKRLLTMTSLQLLESDRHLSSLQEDIEKIKKESNPEEVSRKLMSLGVGSADKVDWERFKRIFVDSNPKMLDRLKEKHPGLTPNDIKLVVLLVSNMDTKNIARLLSINVDSVKKSRQRLRARLGIPSAVDLVDYLKGFRC